MTHTITLIPGDGIGPEVVAEGRKVLDAVAARFGHTFSFSADLIGGIAIIGGVRSPVPAAYR